MPLQLLRFKRRARIAIRLGILATTLRLLKQTTGFIAPSEGVPIIDSAINKIVRLMGGFELDCGDERLNDDMNRFFLLSMSVATSAEYSRLLIIL